jgi:hypothetical protein
MNGAVKTISKISEGDEEYTMMNELIDSGFADYTISITDSRETMGEEFTELGQVEL